MCGICGEINWNGDASLSALQAMTASMTTRGPDAEGYYYQQQLGLGHRRLSVIDRRLLLDPEGELTSKEHSKLWQVAVLEAWFQTHGIN
jgi:asparagine synthetase B (glutamine-hydrolysing)